MVTTHRDTDVGSHVSLEVTITDAAGVPPPSTPPIAHFSAGVDARLGAPGPLIGR